MLWKTRSRQRELVGKEAMPKDDSVGASQCRAEADRVGQQWAPQLWWRGWQIRASSLRGQSVATTIDWKELEQRHFLCDLEVLSSILRTWSANFRCWQKMAGLRPILIVVREAGLTSPIGRSGLSRKWSKLQAEEHSEWEVVPLLR